jgi:hypothetical protein
MSNQSTMDLLVLHAVRLKGFADSAAVARRFGLDPEAAHEDLLDAQARGFVSRHSFADLTGWSLTEAGRRHDESLLRAELDQVAARDEVGAVHTAFLPLNAQAVQAFTAWQLAPTPGPAAGDLVRRLGDVAHELDGLERRLVARLPRFAGYHDRFARALARSADDPVWMTNPEVDSGHTVWFELHEDLTSTLGIPR